MVDLADPRVFEAVVDSLVNWLYLVDHDRKIVYWNRGLKGFRAKTTRCDWAILSRRPARNCDENETRLCGPPATGRLLRDGQPGAAVYLVTGMAIACPCMYGHFLCGTSPERLWVLAEVFEERAFVPETDRRKDDMAKYGCR